MIEAICSCGLRFDSIDKLLRHAEVSGGLSHGDDEYVTYLRKVGDADDN